MYCKNCEFIVNKQKHQIDKKFLRQDRDFSTRLKYASKKIGEIWMNMVNTKYNTTEDMINNLQSLKSKGKLQFYKNISNYHNEMKNLKFQSQEDPSSGNAQGVSKIYHEVLLLMLFLQTKRQIKNMNNNYYDLYYTVIRIRDENKDIDNQYENDNNDYNIFSDIITPNHYIGIKHRETILK